MSGWRMTTGDPLGPPPCSEDVLVRMEAPGTKLGDLIQACQGDVMWAYIVSPVKLELRRLCVVRTLPQGQMRYTAGASGTSVLLMGRYGRNEFEGATAKLDSHRALVLLFAAAQRR